MTRTVIASVLAASALAVVGPEKYPVDFYIPLFELRLKISVVVVVIEGHNIVFAVDRYPVHSKSPDAFDVDSDQVPAFYVLRQSVNKSLFTDYCQAIARNRENTVEMKHVFPQRDPHNII